MHVNIEIKVLKYTHQMDDTVNLGRERGVRLSVIIPHMRPKPNPM